VWVMRGWDAQCCGFVTCLDVHFSLVLVVAQDGCNGGDMQSCITLKGTIQRTALIQCCYVHGVNRVSYSLVYSRSITTAVIPKHGNDVFETESGNRLNIVLTTVLGS